MKTIEKPTLFVDEICNQPLDKSRLTQLPEQSRLTQLPMDASTLAQLTVDASRLMRLPPDVSALMRLPIDPNSEIEREWFGKRPEPEYIEEEEPLSEPPRAARGRMAAVVVALALVAGGAAVAARTRFLASVPLPAVASAPERPATAQPSPR